MAGPCLLSPTKQISSPSQSLGGWDRGHLTVSSLGALESYATLLWQEHISLYSEICQLLILSRPNVTNRPQINASCESKGSYLEHIPGVVGQQFGHFPAQVCHFLHQFGLLFLAPGGPALSLLCRLCLLNTMALWKSLQHVASAAKKNTKISATG